MKDVGISALAEFVRRIRTGQELSQGDVARKAGLARSYISRLEEGEFRSPSVMTLLRLARGLGISNEEMFKVAGVAVKGNGSPDFDVYCRTKLGLPESAVKEMEIFLDYLKQKYANTMVR